MQKTFGYRGVWVFLVKYLLFICQPRVISKIPGTNGHSAIIPGITGAVSFNLEPWGTMKHVEFFADKEFYSSFPSLPFLSPPQSTWKCEHDWKRKQGFYLCKFSKIIHFRSMICVWLHWLFTFLIYFPNFTEKISFTVTGTK